MMRRSVRKLTFRPTKLNRKCVRNAFLEQLDCRTEMKTIFGLESYYKTIAQSSGYNVHTLNSASNAEECWLIILCLNGQLYSFQCSNEWNAIRDYANHLNNLVPFWSNNATKIIASTVSTAGNDDNRLFVLLNVNQTPFLVAFTFAHSGRAEPSWQFIFHKSLIFRPCFIKRFPKWSQQVIVSAIDGRLALFGWTSRSTNIAQLEGDYAELNNQFPSGVIAIDAVVLGTSRITAVGCSDGHLIIFRTVHRLNQIIRKVETKLFEAPISVLALIPDSLGQMHMIISSAVSSPRLYSTIPDEADEQNFVKLTIGHPLDTVLCACHVRLSAEVDGCNHLIYIGTFCCKMLVFSCECSKGIYELVYMRSFLSPVLSIIALNNQMVVVTATGVSAFRTD